MATTGRPGRLAVGFLAMSFVLAGCSEIGPTRENTAPELLTSADEQDAQPAGVGAGPRDITPQTTRYLGEAEESRFWVGESPEGDICLITALPGDDPVSGWSCSSPDQLHKNGIFFGLSSESGTADAMLLPADLDDESRAEATAGIRSDAVVHQDLLVLDPKSAGLPEEPIRIDREGGGTFLLTGP